MAKVIFSAKPNSKFVPKSVRLRFEKVEWKLFLDDGKDLYLSYSAKEKAESVKSILETIYGKNKVIIK